MTEKKEEKKWILIWPDGTRVEFNEEEMDAIINAVGDQYVEDEEPTVYKKLRVVEWIREAIEMWREKELKKKQRKRRD